MKAPKLLSEFAARWRRELDPETVKGGKELRKIISKAGSNPTKDEQKIIRNAKSDLDDNAWDARKKYKIDKERKTPRKLKYTSWNNLSSSDKMGYVDLKEKYPKHIKTNKPKLISTNYPSASKTISVRKIDEKQLLKNDIQKRKYSYKYSNLHNPRVAAGTINPKVISSNNSRQGFNKALQSAGKSGMKKQLLAATAIGGVIGGIALARKTRSDKNKKRGKYKLL